MSLLGLRVLRLCRHDSRTPMSKEAPGTGECSGGEHLAVPACTAMRGQLLYSDFWATRCAKGPLLGWRKMQRSALVVERQAPRWGPRWCRCNRLMVQVTSMKFGSRSPIVRHGFRGGVRWFCLTMKKVLYRCGAPDSRSSSIQKLSQDVAMDARSFGCWVFQMLGLLEAVGMWMLSLSDAQSVVGLMVRAQSCYKSSIRKGVMSFLG
ncbi:hypothetical protein L7F22_005720 [Adiantum nelumboides]|nr:hypothetical protein [Adiantum nelumboides]